MYRTTVSSPVGMLYLASDGSALKGLWLEGQKYFPATLLETMEVSPGLPVFQQTAAWLSAYFTNSELPQLPPLKPDGSPFRQAVWKLLLEIPFGETTTYGALAQKLCAMGISASPQAVGGAVGHNPISIIIPCHRVLGTNGSLTGYAGGLKAKEFLLNLETINRREKKMVYPKAVNNSHLQVTRQKDESTPLIAGRYSCPCCSCRTFPVPASDAIAYICPVCMWENDVFTVSDDEPSDENHGMTLNQGRAQYRLHGVSNLRLLPYVRKPTPEELPND